MLKVRQAKEGKGMERKKYGKGLHCWGGENIIRIIANQRQRRAGGVSVAGPGAGESLQGEKNHQYRTRGVRRVEGVKKRFWD